MQLFCKSNFKRKQHDREQLHVPRLQLCRTNCKEEEDLKKVVEFKNTTRLTSDATTLVVPASRLGTSLKNAYHSPTRSSIIKRVSRIGASAN